MTSLVLSFQFSLHVSHYRSTDKKSIKVYLMEE